VIKFQPGDIIRYPQMRPTELYKITSIDDFTLDRDYALYAEAINEPKRIILVMASEIEPANPPEHEPLEWWESISE